MKGVRSAAEVPNGDRTGSDESGLCLTGSLYRGDFVCFILSVLRTPVTASFRNPRLRYRGILAKRLIVVLLSRPDVPLKEYFAQIDRATAGQLALFLIGVSLIIVAPAAEPWSGTLLELEDGEPQDSVPENASVIAYQDLPSGIQNAFQTALETDESQAQLQEGASVGTLYNYDYIRYQGGYYEFYFVAVDRAGTAQVLLVGGLGVTAVVAAGIWRLGSA